MKNVRALSVLAIVCVAAPLGARAADAANDSAQAERPSPLSKPRFEDIGDIPFRSDQAQGLAGNKDGAFRVAEMYRDGTNGVPRDRRRMLQWLRYASELGSGAASYQLYLHYLARGLDRDALRYENRALEQGYEPPPRLDPRRG